jgi:hypothetical protein
MQWAQSSASEQQAVSAILFLSQQQQAEGAVYSVCKGECTRQAATLKKRVPWQKQGSRVNHQVCLPGSKPLG